MALFINEATSSLSDFVSKLHAFLTTAGAGNPGWTNDRLVTGSGEMAVSKDCAESGHAVEVAFQWDTSTPSALGVYQYRSGTGAGSYNTGLAPYAQANDSGNGATSTSNATLLNSRRVLIGNSPVQYWAFAGDDSNGETYAHVTVQVDATHFVHFGFGMLEKVNDWTGGEYAYGMRVNTVAAAGVQLQQGTTILLDGFAIDNANAGNVSNGMELFMATVRCQNLPGQAATGLYAVVGENQTDTGNDRQSTPRARVNFLGGFRAGEAARSFGQLQPNTAQGFVPGYPIFVAYIDKVPVVPDVYMPMGFMRDVRGVNISQFTAGQQLVYAGDTWVVFPTRAKGTGADTSGNQGIMYRIRT